MIEVFVHPYTKSPLKKDSDGNLYSLESNSRDIYKFYDGCFDFAATNPGMDKTRKAYDECYAKEQKSVLTLSEVTKPWFDVTIPWRKTMLQHLGPLSGRNVLLLGSGSSYKEFYFLHLGANVVFTDLSIIAVRNARSMFLNSELSEKHRDKIEFHAVDAMHLPFPNESFDVIYGAKFVGFLNNPSYFFSEVKRCLKPGGICRFVDDAYSPLWNAIRHSTVVPLKTRMWEKMSSLSRIRSGSPSNSFGFKEESLIGFLKQFGFARMLIIREYFFLRITQLLWQKLVRSNPKRCGYAKPIYLIMKWIDNRFTNTTWMKRNAMALTWGFDK
jgi:SAM-dependent methyltransferase